MADFQRPSRQPRIPLIRWGRRLLQYLVAVVVGNAAYFAVMPWLPPKGRQHPFRLDLGLGVLIDFWFCVACYGVLNLLPYFKNKDRLSQMG
jgi:hypothetical protein